MSQWTHIAGCIRIDSVVDPTVKLTLKNQFGNTVEFDSPEEDWNKCNVPCGSEGSVQYRIEQTGDDNSLAWGLIYIWGDLRDYDNVQEIYDWINRACQGLMIRSCSVKVDIEGKNSFIIYENNETLFCSELHDLKKCDGKCAVIYDITDWEYCPTCGGMLKLKEEKP
jgi:hypothetical protein